MFCNCRILFLLVSTFLGKITVFCMQLTIFYKDVNCDNHVIMYIVILAFLEFGNNISQ